MKRAARLTRTAFPRRSQPLRQVSAAHARQQRQQRQQKQAYAAADDAEVVWCEACGKPEATDHSHHFTQSQHPAHRNDQRNWLKLCRTDHNLFEHHKAAFAARYPEVWARILEQMEAVDAVAFRAFRLKNPF